jgi:tRNA nucleotidyltransferase (CCA-adding enzyme)
LEPTKEVQDLQKNVDDRVREKIENVIKSKTDKVLKVETQGSYVKGTDLPSSGSDMDIFVVFKSDTPEKDMQQLGLEIGLETMTKEFAESQGWENFRVFTKDANSKYAEAYFDVDGQNIEVQIVPTRDLTLDQIKNKELNGEKISIGMERTPHQTKFMNDNLTKEQKKDVRMLKKLMKETGLYDSSVKSQGFSGYSAEALVHYLGSFDKIIDYFASDFKVGGVIGLPNGKKESDYHKITDQSNSSWRPFHIIDPIDPNRDLTTAFSPKKIARTILTSKSLKETGEPPKKTKPISLKGVGLNFKSDIDDENTLNGQIQSLEKDMIAKLNRIGFRNIKEFDKPKKIVEGFEINPDRTSIEQGEENEKNDYTLNIAFENYYLDTDETVSVKDISNMKEQAKDNMFDGMKKAGTKYVVSDDETTVSIYGKKKYTSIEDTVNGFLEGETIEGQKLSNSNLLKEIQKQQVKSVKNQSYYDNLI